MKKTASGSIEINPDIRFGKPCIAGTRIAVQDVVIAHKHNNTPLERVAETYNVTLAQLQTALTYYNEHQAEIDAAILDTQDTLTRDNMPGIELLKELREKRRKSQG